MGEVVYREGGSWRPLWLTLGGFGLGFSVDLVTGGGPHLLGWLLGLALVGGVVALSCYAQARTASVGVTTVALRAGREVLPLTRLDPDRLGAAEQAGGAQVGARILGGALSVPTGSAALPLPLADGSTVLVVSRDPAALRDALLRALAT